MIFISNRRKIGHLYMWFPCSILQKKHKRTRYKLITPLSNYEKHLHFHWKGVHDYVLELEVIKS